MKNVNDWGRIYRQFDAPLTKSDCGILCARTATDALPVCCDNSRHIPVLYSDELAWHRKHRTGVWTRCKTSKPRARHGSDHLILCRCTGSKRCNRRYRSLSCRFFPFEPYLDESGKIAGLVLMETVRNGCRLAEQPGLKISPEYLEQAIRTWRIIFELYPEEYRLYHRHSKALRRKSPSIGSGLRVFKSRPKKSDLE